MKKKFQLILAVVVVLPGIGRQAFGAAVLPVTGGLLYQVGAAGAAKIAYDESNCTFGGPRFQGGLAGLCLIPGGTATACLAADGINSGCVDYTLAGRGARVLGGPNASKSMFIAPPNPVARRGLGGLWGPNTLGQCVCFGSDDAAGNPCDPAQTHHLVDAAILRVGPRFSHLDIDRQGDSQPVRTPGRGRSDTANVGGAAGWMSVTLGSSYLSPATPGAITAAR